MNTAITSGTERIKPRFTVVNYRDRDFLSYGEHNGYPTRMARILHASPVGVACRNKLVEFLVGRGFEDPTHNEIVINRRGETLLDLAEWMACDLADYNSFHIMCVYNLNGQIDSLLRVDPEHVRKSSPDSFGYSPRVIIHNNWYYDNYAKAEYGVSPEYKVDVFNPRHVPAQIEHAGGIRSWNGQVLSYWGKVETYPRTIYDSVVHDLATNAYMGVKAKVDLEKGYMAGTIISVKEKMTKKERGDFLQDIAHIQGPDGNRILLIDGVDEKVEVDFIQTNFSDGQFTLTDQRVRRVIMNAFQQLPILHGEDRANAISADGKAIETAFDFYNQQTLKMRSIISKNISKLMRLFRNPIEDGFMIEPLTFETAKQKSENQEQEKKGDDTPPQNPVPPQEEQT